MNYGCEREVYLADGRIKFGNKKLRTATRIDERNLNCALYLDLSYSSITSLDTEHISGLLGLVLHSCNISSLNTLPLTRLIHLDISFTAITEILTEPFG